MVSDTPIFSMMKQKLAYLSERQAVLSKNIANANTPKYKAEDLAPLDFGTMLQQSQSITMKTTHPGHIQTGGENGRFQRIKDENTFETSPSGNNVVLDEQLTKMAGTNFDYQSTTSVYRKMIELMKTTLGSGNR